MNISYSFFYIKLLFVITFFCKISFGQNIENSKDDIILAEKLSKIYPDEKVVSLEYIVNISFENITSGVGRFPVAAIMKTDNKLISLKDAVYYTGVFYYDKQSDIINISATNLKGKKDESFSYSNQKVESDGIFYDDEMVCIYNTSFSSKGKTLILHANKNFYDVKYLTSFFFHDNFPILKYTLVINVPEWLDMEIVEKNFSDYIIYKNIEKNEKLKCKKYTYKLENLSARKQEKNTPHPSKNLPHIIFLSKYYINKAGQKNNLFASINDLYSWYYKLIPKDSTHSAELKTLVKVLTKDTIDDLQKIKSIYYWVQDNIRYIAFENGIMGFKPENPNKVYQNRYGDCKGMASLLKQLLVIAGYDARLTWLGTKRLAYDYSIPSLIVDNHMICAVFYKNKVYFLDPTYKYCPFLENNYQIQGRQVLIENNEKYILDTIPKEGPEINSISAYVKIKIDSVKDILNVSANFVYKGEEKNKLFYYYHSWASDKKNENMKKYLSGHNKNISITDITAVDFEDRDKPLNISIDFNIDNGIIRAAKELYVNINEGIDFTMNSFDTSRVNDYEFNNTFSFNTTIEMTIPTGYDVTYLPEKTDVDYKYFTGNYSYEMKNNNTIVLKKQFVLKKDIVKKIDFNEWNTEANQINKFLKDQLIFKKI